MSRTFKPNPFRTEMPTSYEGLKWKLEGFQERPKFRDPGSEIHKYGLRRQLSDIVELAEAATKGASYRKLTKAYKELSATLTDMGESVAYQIPKDYEDHYNEKVVANIQQSVLDLTGSMKDKLQGKRQGGYKRRKSTRRKSRKRKSTRRKSTRRKSRKRKYV
jgi:hypothetical protein